MNITITGRQVDTGDSLRNHVETRLEEMMKKYFQRGVNVNVTFSKERHNFHCVCTAHLTTGLVVKANASDTRVPVSFDFALDKLEKQIRRYKRRLQRHHDHSTAPLPATEVPSYVLAAAPEEEPEEDVEGGDQPVIVAETKARLRHLTVGDAVMQMEIAHVPLLVFRNNGNGRVNVVYQREDGNIGWIDPREEGESA